MTAPGEKPERLEFQTYLQMIRNSVGSGMFRNYYVRSREKGEFDALGDGENSCAFYVSAVLLIFKKLSGAHGTVASTIKDLENSGWQAVKNPRPGDVVVWEAMDFPDGRYEHIGFYIADGRAVSTSWTEKVVVEHDLNFGETKRPIKQIYRMNDW
jgi:hypothetical protein